MAVNSDLKERLMRLWGSNTLRLQKVRSASTSGLSQSGPVWSVFEDPATKTGAEARTRSQTTSGCITSRKPSTENCDVVYSASNETSAKSKRSSNLVSSYVNQFNSFKSVSDANEDQLMNNDHQNVSRVRSKSVSGYASQLNSLESYPESSKEEFSSKSEKTEDMNGNQEKLITGKSVSKYVKMLNALNTSFESSNVSNPSALDSSSLASLPTPRARTSSFFKGRTESLEKPASPRDRLTSYGSGSLSNSEAGSEVFDDQDRLSSGRRNKVSSYVKLLNSGKPIIDLPSDTGSLSMLEANYRVEDAASLPPVRRTSLDFFFGNGEDCDDGKGGQKGGKGGKGESNVFNDPRRSQNFSEKAKIVNNTKLEEALTNQFTEDEGDAATQNSENDQRSYGITSLVNGQINAGSTRTPDYEHERLPEEKQRISKTDFQRVRERMNRLEQEEVVTVERKGSAERRKVVSGNILEISKRFSGNLN